MLRARASRAGCTPLKARCMQPDSPVDRPASGPCASTSAEAGRGFGWRGTALCGLALLAAGCLVAPYDVAIARWIQRGECPDALEKLACLAEAFAHGFGAGAVMLTIYLLDPGRRRALLRLAVMSLGVGTLTDMVKLLLARQRPYHFDLSGETADTFGQWLPGWSEGAAWQSFPSSHSAVAAGLAIGLARLYPRGKWLFVTYAALAVLQRVVVRAHFASDVCWGAGLGCILAAACLTSTAERCFRRFESRGKSGGDRPAACCYAASERGEPARKASRAA